MKRPPSGGLFVVFTTVESAILLLHRAVWTTQALTGHAGHG